MALLAVCRASFGNSQCAVVLHVTRASVLSWGAERDACAVPNTCAVPDTFTQCMPVLSLRTVGTNSLWHCVVLWHDDSGCYVRESEYHQPELDLRRLNTVHTMI